MDFMLANPDDAQKTYLSYNSTSSWEIWHRYFGHVRYSGLQKLLKNKLVEGLEINMKMLKPDCIACIEAKLFEAPYGSAMNRYMWLGQLTHLDLWGKYDIASIHGN
jgi:hypothetical protein